MKLQSDAEFAALVGIDWADTKHDICLQVATSEEREFAVVPHRADAIEAWVGSLRHRFEGQPVSVGLELAKGPLVYALQKYDFRSEERRVGKECRSRWLPDHEKKKITD